MKYVCIHGHFYQPPRENPWLDSIETQDSAYPFHDWNERITAECYGPNAMSRILDHEGFVTALSNNYSRISFNFGPTLLSWMQVAEPSVYEAILRADRESVERFSGHGSALAQAYNHLIMPLANERDRRTQVIWGIRDFENRFQRRPEGMWLPETAVDTPTLEALAEEGISFTILAPRQAKRVRPIGQDAWTDVSGGKVDTTRPYLCLLPSGRQITLFFYDGAISQDVAFNNLLSSGHTFADRLTTANRDTRSNHDPLVHIATDGETYGHHHRFGDMALASALQELEANADVTLTVYGEYLSQHPPEFEVQVVEESSWSCEHGVERWRSNCGCGPGRHSGWQQRWRGPLRDALDWLRDTVNPQFERAAAELFSDPWAARDDYIHVVLDRSQESIGRFISANALPDIANSEPVRMLKLMELQRNLMLCYTSCGWFFDEISDIEPLQVLEYAAMAVQLAEELFGVDFEEGFLERLERAQSNVPEMQNGRTVYLQRIKPRIVKLQDVAAHSAINLLFKVADPLNTAFEVTESARHESMVSDARFLSGRLEVTSRTTLESAQFDFAVLDRGGQDVLCGVRPVSDPGGESTLVSKFARAVSSGDVQGLISQIEEEFGNDLSNLRHLIGDTRRNVLKLLIDSASAEAEKLYLILLEDQVQTARSLMQVGRPVPESYGSAAEYLLTALARRELDQRDRPVDISHVRDLLEKADQLGVSVDGRGIGRELEVMLETMLAELREGRADSESLALLAAGVQLAQHPRLQVDLWHAQAMMFDIARTRDPNSEVASSEAGYEEQFTALSSALKVRRDGARATS